MFGKVSIDTLFCFLKSSKEKYIVINYWFTNSSLSLLWRSSLHIETIDLLCKSMDWFLYDKDLRQERFNKLKKKPVVFKIKKN